MTSANELHGAQSHTSEDRPSLPGQGLVKINTPLPTNEVELHSMSAESGSDYGDFGIDPEELEIVDAILSQIESQTAPHFLTDIEDYESPRGVRLPKILGVESKPQREAPNTGQVLHDLKASHCTSALTSTWQALTD
jgi:hypothetical protein